MSSREGRTEAPTPKRRKEAREKGQIARSQDLVAWSMVLALSYLVPLTARRVIQAARETWDRALRVGEETDALPKLMGSALQSSLTAMLPLLITVSVIALALNLAQIGFLFSGKPLKPDFKRVNPISGFKRVFGPRALWETVKQILKAATVFLAVWPRLRSVPDRYLARGGLPLHKSLPMALDDVLGLVRVSSYAMIAIAVADYMFQRYQTTKDLRMTRQEVRDEYRNAEGDPMVKARRRSIARQMSMNNMLRDVASAQVVVTNPTHLAVALAYDPAKGPAPKVVAVGADKLAAKIREEARRAGVPIVEAKPLARALYKSCKVGDEIPVLLYDAVARVLAFIRRLHPMLKGPDPMPLPSVFTVDVPDVERARRGRRAVRS